MSRRGWLLLAVVAAVYAPIVALAVVQPTGVAPRWVQVAVTALVVVEVVATAAFVVFAIVYSFPRKDE